MNKRCNASSPLPRAQIQIFDISFTVRKKNALVYRPLLTHCTRLHTKLSRELHAEERKAASLWVLNSNVNNNDRFVLTAGEISRIAKRRCLIEMTSRFFRERPDRERFFPGNCLEEFCTARK